MSEENTNPVEETRETSQDGANPEVKGILHDLKDERAKRQALAQELADIKAANEAAEKQRMEEQNKYKELYEAEVERVNDYKSQVDTLTPIVDQFNADNEKRKTALLEKLGDDAERFQGLDIPALEKVVEKLTKTSPPKEPGKPGMSPAGKFGGYETLNELALAAARGVPGAREEYDKAKIGGA